MRAAVWAAKAVEMALAPAGDGKSRSKGSCHCHRRSDGVSRDAAHGGGRRGGHSRRRRRNKPLRSSRAEPRATCKGAACAACAAAHMHCKRATCQGAACAACAAAHMHRKLTTSTGPHNIAQTLTELFARTRRPCCSLAALHPPICSLFTANLWLLLPLCLSSSMDPSCPPRRPPGRRVQMTSDPDVAARRLEARTARSRQRAAKRGGGDAAAARADSVPAYGEGAGAETGGGNSNAEHKRGARRKSEGFPATKRRWQQWRRSYRREKTLLATLAPVAAASTAVDDINAEVS